MQIQARSRDLARLDAILNRARIHKVHLLTSVLWLRGGKMSAVRRLAGAALAGAGDRSRELRAHELLGRPPGHP